MPIFPIDTIYDQYKIPVILREHMKRVAALSELVCDHWTGPAIDKTTVITAALLHDLGNIIKFDFDSAKTIELMGGPEKVDVEYWKKAQQEIINKYGQDDHLITNKILDELELSDRIKFIVNNKNFTNNQYIVDSNDWELMIVSYADSVMAPDGIRSLEQRITEEKERNKDKPKASINHPQAELLINCAYQIQEKVLAQTTLSKEEINNTRIKPYLNEY